MRTLHIDTERTWRGGEQQMFYLARGLLSIGHEPLLVCQTGGVAVERAEREGIPVVSVKMRGEADVLAAMEIAAIARRHGSELLHAHTSHAHALAVLAKFLLRGKCPVLVHRRVDFSIHKLPLRLGLLKYRFGVNRYVTTSGAIREVLVQDGVPASQVDVVRSCTDLSRFDDVSPADVRVEFGLPRDSVIVGNVGFLVGHKDHANLVRAAAIVRQTHPEVYFIVVGEGELRASIEALRDELGLHGHFILAGFRSDVPSLLAGFDIFAMSSCMEGLGGAILEAMASRVPLATTNAGGMAEIAADSENALVVPTQNPSALARAIVRLIEAPEEARRLAAAGRRTVEQRFSTDNLLEQTLEVYRCVCARTDR